MAFFGDLGKMAERLLGARETLAARQPVRGEQQVIEHSLLGENPVTLDNMHQPGLRGVARACPAQITPLELNGAGPG